jgi:crotonobetainyl-CoA:carnitine CoA-transferase CaiB-like acyl-CoA transferase
VRNREPLAGLVSDRLRERDTADWHARLTAAGVPAAPVADVADVVNADQTQALDLLQPVPHAGIPDVRLPALPLSFDRERATLASAPPAVGEHTAEILGEVGYSSDEIDALVRECVIRTAGAV